jgi:hypothetical protein
MNVNAEVREEDVFALGDDDEEDEDGDGDESHALDEPASAKSGASADPAQARRTPDGALEKLPTAPATLPNTSTPPSPPAAYTSAEERSASPAAAATVYHLKPSDTLHGLALRFGVPARTLCTLNKLPFSTLSTTPHLLHTRTSIVLSASAQLPDGALPVISDVAVAEASSKAREEKEERRRRRVREQAEKRLQVLTKEVDWRVARAYVALAEDGPSPADEDASFLRAVKAKEAGMPVPPVHAGLEGRAIDAYLEDNEWEANLREESSAQASLGVPPKTVKDEKAKVTWGTGRLW